MSGLYENKQLTTERGVTVTLFDDELKRQFIEAEELFDKGEGPASQRQIIQRILMGDPVPKPGRRKRDGPKC